MSIRDPKSQFFLGTLSVRGPKSLSVRNSTSVFFPGTLSVREPKSRFFSGFRPAGNPNHNFPCQDSKLQFSQDFVRWGPNHYVLRDFVGQTSQVNNSLAERMLESAQEGSARGVSDGFTVNLFDPSPPSPLSLRSPPRCLSRSQSFCVFFVVRVRSTRGALLKGFDSGHQSVIRTITTAVATIIVAKSYPSSTAYRNTRFLENR